jgi:flagellar biosynthetic protein FlhB
MADEQEKTEEPTSKKIEKAREEGNVAKSQDVSGFVTLVIGITVLIVYTRYMFDELSNFYVYYIGFIGQEITFSTFFNMVIESILKVLILLAPLALAIMIAGILGNVGQFGFNFTTKVLSPKFEKLNFIKGLKNLFTLKKLVEGTKMTLKVAVAFGVGFWLFTQFLEEIPKLEIFPLMDQIEWLLDKAIVLAFTMLAVFLVFAAIDFVWQKHSYKKSLKMSKQEVKDEHKNQEGNPEVKARIRRLQMQMAMNRMMGNVPKADVVITNPTHYAVAIQYSKEEGAPKVLAKGVDHLAQRIKEVARENDVMIVENKPLARDLYASVEVEEFIPDRLYKAVAEVLAYVYKAKKRN